MKTDSEADAERRTKKNCLELVDVGGGGADEVIEESEDVPFNEVSSFPEHDPRRIIGFALQQNDLHTIASKRRLSHSDKQLQKLDRAYGDMLAQNFGKKNVGSNLWGMSLREKYGEVGPDSSVVFLPMNAGMFRAEHSSLMFRQQIKVDRIGHILIILT